MIKIGFWKDTKSTLDLGLLVALPDPRELADPTWAGDERYALGAYLDSGKTFESWMGFSYCRFDCGIHLRGNKDLTDGVYVWPQDLSHYVRAHSVRLPTEFIEHVRAVRKRATRQR